MHIRVVHMMQNTTLYIYSFSYNTRVDLWLDRSELAVSPLLAIDVFNTKQSLKWYWLGPKCARARARVRACVCVWFLLLFWGVTVIDTATVTLTGPYFEGTSRDTGDGEDISGC